ncbi:hypothetical protein OH828_14530 [Streptomyces anulatus]|uniref:hypothetical protein n=1 Tax=Streptomyces anulatus TaxID=1892 RepID=UPI003867F7DC
MQRYRLADGITVEESPLADGGFEFVTIRPGREVTSTVVKYGDEARTMRASLQVAGLMTFVDTYGMGSVTLVRSDDRRPAPTIQHKATPLSVFGPRKRAYARQAALYASAVTR